MSNSNDEMLTRKQAAELLGIDPHTMACWRSRGTGPAMVKFGAGRSAGVRYRRSAIEAWIRDPQAAELEAGEPWRAERLKASSRGGLEVIRCRRTKEDVSKKPRSSKRTEWVSGGFIELVMPLGGSAMFRTVWDAKSKQDVAYVVDCDRSSELTASTIAAAPELLRACEEALKAVSGRIEFLGVVNVLQNAIGKALPSDGTISRKEW